MEFLVNRKKVDLPNCISNIMISTDPKPTVCLVSFTLYKPF